VANHKRHIGIIRPTVPNPEIFWGSIQEIAEYCNLNRRSVSSLINGVVSSTKKGFRRMTPEEEILHYQPPRPPNKNNNKKKCTYKSKKFWKITFFKDWKKGEKYPTDPKSIYSGSTQDFVRFTGCNSGQIYRLINTHEGNLEKYPLKSIKGWSIARIRRYSKPYVRQSRIKES